MADAILKSVVKTLVEMIQDKDGDSDIKPSLGNSGFGTVTFYSKDDPLSYTNTTHVYKNTIVINNLVYIVSVPGTSSSDISAQIVITGPFP